MSIKTTQKERLLTWLKARGTINAIEAWEQLGIYRLSDVIFKLKKDGECITTHEIEVQNRYGEAIGVGKYVYQPRATIRDTFNFARPE